MALQRIVGKKQTTAERKEKKNPLKNYWGNSRMFDKGGGGRENVSRLLPTSMDDGGEEEEEA